MIERGCRAEVSYTKAVKPSEKLGSLKCEPCVFDKKVVAEPDVVIKTIADFRVNNCIKEVPPPQI
jgi:hypothetical protein